MVSTHLKNDSQIGSFPQIGLNIKNLWNHHLVPECRSFVFQWKILAVVVSEKTLTGWKRSICWYHFPHIVGIKNASIFEGSIQIKTCFMVQIHPWRLIWNIIPWSFGSDHFFLSISWLMAVGSSRYNLPGCKSVITWHISHTLSWCHFRAFIPRHAPWHQANPSLFACLLENVGRWEVAVVNHPNQHSFHSHLSLGSYKGGHVLGVSASRNATLSYVFWVHMGWGGVGWGGVVFTFLQTCTRWWCTHQECYCYGIHGVGWGCVHVPSTFNLHTLVMYTPGMLLLRHSWGGVGWGCVHVPSTFNLHTLVMYTPGMLLLRYPWVGVGLCSRSFNLQLAHAGDVHARECYCYGTHGVGWGGVVFTFLQLAHAGDVHTRNVTATALMGWGGVGLCSRSFNLQLAHAGDVHTRNVTATALMGCGGVGLCSRSFNLQLAHAGDVHARNVTATVSMGWGGVVFTFLQPSTCTRWWCTRQECYCYGTHGVGWGGVVFTFLQLAHAGDVHTRNVTATALMGWGGVGLCSRSFNLQLAHAGDVHTRNVTATALMGWGGVGLCSRSFKLAHAGDVHARNVTATALMGWGGVGLCSRSFNLQLAHAGDVHARNVTATVSMGWGGAMCSPASASYANKTDQKDRKKEKKRRGVSHTCKYNANNSEFEEKTPFEARVSEFLRKLTISLQVLYARKPWVFPHFVQKSCWCWYWKSQTLQRSCRRCDHVLP